MNRIKVNRASWATAILATAFMFCGLQTATGQTEITSIDVVYESVNDSSNDYTTGGRNYFFNSGNDNNLLILSVDAGGFTYYPALFANRIEMQRVSIPGIPDNQQVFFYEGSVSGNDVLLKPSFKNTMKEVLLSPVLNRGVDNIFQNTGDGSGNVNNVMRLDLIFDDGITIPSDFDKQGFIIKERGGNDPIKIAAITSLDGSGNPASFGPIVSATPSQWGASGISLQTQVLRKPDLATPAIQSANLNPQPITGILFTFEDLGLNPNDVIYGYSLAAGDAPTNSTEWLNPSIFPTNTNASNGGLDLIAGGAYFSSSPSVEALDDSFSTPFETALNATVINNDTFSPGSVFSNTSNPSNGSLTMNADGSFTYVPSAGFDGADSFTYQVCLPAPIDYICDTATVSITVEAPAGSITNLFPASGFGTLAFEDLWPGKGDFDFNDLVVDYQFEITSNATNHVEQVVATFTVRAFGAGYQNGFGFQLSDAINASDLSVSGHHITENYITLSPNGTEAGQNAPTIIVFDNNYTVMQHPGSGIGVNTEPGAPYVQPETLTITIGFPANAYTLNDLDIGSFNPFLIVNQKRGREIHLPYYPPTALADHSYFGTVDDASNPGQGITYVTSNNLPWAINIYESFDYPIEKQDIVWVHLKFVEWAESGGAVFQNWYQNLPGFRNQALIYQVP